MKTSFGSSPFSSTTSNTSPKSTNAEQNTPYTSAEMNWNKTMSHFKHIPEVNEHWEEYAVHITRDELKKTMKLKKYDKLNSGGTHSRSK